MTSSEYKAKAKELLMGKKMNAALMVLVMILIVGISSGVLGAIFPGEVSRKEIAGVQVDVSTSNPIASLASSVISIFITLGEISYFMKIARGEEPELKDLFSQGNLVLKALITSILVGIIVILGCVALIIPGIILCFAYSFVNYIYIDNPGIGIVEVMKKSREMMKGHKWQYFCLMFSFIGWWILVPFTLGILMFWLTPYMAVTAVLFYDSIKEDSAEKTTEVSEVSETTTPNE